MTSCLAFLFITPLVSAAYQPVTYATTALLGTRLYIIGGQTDLTLPTSYTAQIATISLTDSFDGDTPPWDFMPNSFATARAPGVPARDQRRIFLGGNTNNLGHSPAMAFDTNTRIWTQAPELPGGASAMKNYTRSASGVALDTSNGVLVQFGGANATGQPTNELSLLDTGKPSGIMSWSFNGLLHNLPALYAPIVVYLPNTRTTLIMGGCDQLDTQGNPAHCASFDTLYTISSETVTSTMPVARQINATAVPNSDGTAGPMPPPRVMACAVVLADGNVLVLGGGNPKSPLADAWVLNIQNWTWLKRAVGGIPEEGIMGHSCELTRREQILVIGGHHGDTFVSRPISIIRMQDWHWVDKYEVPGFSVGVKIGLTLSIVVVVGAIVAGLLIRRQRIRKTRNVVNVKKPTSGSSQAHHNGRRASGRTRREHRDRNSSRQASIHQSLDNAERGQGPREFHRQSSSGGPRSSSADDYPMTPTRNRSFSPDGSVTSTVIGSMSSPPAYTTTPVQPSS
ncbi:F-box only protein 42 [Podila horticola]|nr:F-box only protein 42 [Podila horticola]